MTFRAEIQLSGFLRQMVRDEDRDTSRRGSAGQVARVVCSKKHAGAAQERLDEAIARGQQLLQRRQ